MQQTAVLSDNGTLALFPRTCVLISNYPGIDLKLLLPGLISNYPPRFAGPTATSEADPERPRRSCCMPWKAAWFKNFPRHDGRLRKRLITSDSSGGLPVADSSRLDGEPVKQVPTVPYVLMYQPDKQVLACLMGSLRCNRHEP